MVDLGTLGGSYSSAVAVNPSGQIVGSGQTSSGASHATCWSRTGAVVDLGTLGGDFSVATAVDPGGRVVGKASTASGQTHAAMWQCPA